nr:uncharacterized mitochondrial protein AtMg00810-like [Tanacetum cinerariifolium]
MSVKTASTPTETKKPLVKDAEAANVDVHLYRSMIGSLMYLTASRLDIMYAVCACFRFQVTPKTSHLHVVKRIFRYLKGQPKLGLWYPRELVFDLESYSDSDYARANLDRKSTTGGCQFLGRRLISWQCKKQTIVATSTTKAEYVAAASYWKEKAKTGTNIEEGDFNKLDDLVDEGVDYVVNEWMSTDKIKVLNAEAEGVSVAGETLSTTTLAISTASVQPVLLKCFDNQEAKMGMRKFFKCWFHHHTTNGLQFTMSNQYQELASLKANGFCKEFTSPKQTSLGKDISNPLLADSFFWVKGRTTLEFGHVARECHKPKRVKDAAYHREKMILCKQEEAGIQLNAKQADWRNDTDDEFKDQELEAHYMYMAQIQEVSPDAVDSGPIFDTDPVQKVSTNNNYNVFAIKSEHPEQSESIHDTYPIVQDEHNVIIDSLDMSYDREQIDQDDDNDLANERELLASLIEKLKCEIDDSKNRNKFLETSNKVLVKKLKGEIADFKNKSLESSNNRFKEANNKLSETNKLLYDDFKKSQAELERRNDVKYASKLNNLYALFVPQREKSSEQRYFSERSRLSHTPINNGNSKASFNKQTTLLEKRMDESISWDQKCKSSKELFEIKISVGTIFDGVKHCKETIATRKYFGHLDPFIQNTIEANFYLEIRRINAGLEQFHVCLNEEMVADLRYFNSLELNSLRSQPKTQKTRFLNEIDRLSREYYYADHMNAILGVYTELDEVTNFQCDYLEMLDKCGCLKKELSKSKNMSKSFETVQKHAINLELELQQCKEKMKNDKSFKVNLSQEFCKERKQYFEIQDLKAQLQDKGIAISELKKLIEKLKGKSVDTKFEKSSVIRQPNAFKSQRQSILGKSTIFSDSLERKDFSKSKSVTKNNVSNDFSKPVTAQILPPNKKSILKNMNVLAPRMYKLHTKPTQTRTSQFPNDSRNTNKHVSFSTGVIPITSVSRPQLKRNPMEDRVMLNNSQGKKQEVEDHRRNVKFSKNKTSVTACNDSLNAKTLNVTFVYATCGKCVLNEKHDMCVLKSRNGVNSRTKMPVVVPISTRETKCTVKQSVAKPLRKTVDSESNQKPRNTLRKLYERVSKACSWWYLKYTPSGYNWEPKSKIGNVNLNVGMPLGNASRTTNVLDPKTSRCSTVSNTPLSSNSFAARRDCLIHRRLWVLKAYDEKSQATN